MGSHARNCCIAVGQGSRGRNKKRKSAVSVWRRETPNRFLSGSPCEFCYPMGFKAVTLLYILFRSRYVHSSYRRFAFRCVPVQLPSVPFFIP
jgi:hypothetical protein